jgi:hypothetical protein
MSIKPYFTHFNFKFFIGGRLIDSIKIYLFKMDPTQQPYQTTPGQVYPPQVQGQPVYVQQPVGQLAAPIGMNYNDAGHQAGLIRRVHADHPIHMLCPNCSASEHTKVHHYNGVASWSLCITMALVGFGCCALIPLCCEPCQDADHECHKCGKVIATKRVAC